MKLIIKEIYIDLHFSTRNHRSIPEHPFKVHMPVSGKNMKCHTNAGSGGSEMEFVSRMSCELAHLFLVSLTWETRKQVFFFISLPQVASIIKTFLSSRTTNLSWFHF